MPDKVKERWRQMKEAASPDDKSHAILQARGGTMTVAERMQWKERQAQLRHKWAAFFKDYDVVLSPVLMRTAFKHDQQSDWSKRKLTVNGIEREYIDVLLWAGPAVVSYLPASVAPVGITSEGLPAGIQIVGPHLEDKTPIAVAGMLEEILGGFRAPPGW